jgi:hypothetical protein
MKSQLSISTHEPDQPIAGIVEAIQDSNEMLRVGVKKKQSASECSDMSEKSALETQKDKEGNRYFFSEQERESLADLVREVQEFSKAEATLDAQEALRELCNGIFESEENLASHHDFFLYGAPKRK